MGSKFIPGVSTVAPPIAGAMRMPVLRFTIAAGLAVAMYAGVGLALGRIFHAQMGAAFAMIDENLRVAGLVFATLVALYIASKVLQRWLFRRRFRMARISVGELRQLLETGAPIIIMDVRARSAREREPGLIGAFGIDADRLEQHLQEIKRQTPIDPSSEIVLYCACPNEASAVMIARRLARQGYKQVRPLEGGLDAWMKTGLPVASL